MPGVFSNYSSLMRHKLRLSENASNYCRFVIIMYMTKKNDCCLYLKSMAKVQLAKAVTRHTGGGPIDDEIQSVLLRSTSDRQS